MAHGHGPRGDRTYVCTVLDVLDVLYVHTQTEAQDLSEDGSFHNFQ